MKTLVIIDELSELLDAPSEQSFGELEKSILAEGVRDAIVVWRQKGAIADGFTRYKIATKHGLDFPTVERDFDDIAQVKDWMLRNQLGRRNLSPDRFTYFIGKLYNETVAEQARNAVGKFTATGTVSEEIGKSYGVAEKTVRRAGEIAKGIDIVAKVKGPEAKVEHLSGKKSFTKTELSAIGNAPSVSAARRKIAAIEAAKVPSSVPVVEKKYSVIYCEPDFDGGIHVKPPMAKEAVVYMWCPDYFLMEAMLLMKQWGLDYQGSFVLPCDREPGTWTNIEHSFLLCGTRETMIGPDDRHICGSMKLERFGVAALVEKYHPKAEKIDMSRRGPFKGWDKP